MKLFHIVRQDPYSYDEYSDAIVVAKDEEEAIQIHPDGDKKWVEKFQSWANETDLKYLEQGEEWYYSYDDWTNPNNVEATYIGQAARGLKRGEVICHSFHAG